jgi:hypothetical protein
MLEYMPQFAEFTRDEQYTVDAIVRRAVQLGIYDDPKDAEMDIAATHVHCPLDLAKLWSAPDSSFGHDMGGIQRYLDRRTGLLEDNFDPRCSAPVAAIDPEPAPASESWYRISIRTVKTKGHHFLDSSGGLTRQKVHAAMFSDQAKAEQVAADINAQHSDVYQATVKVVK